MRPVKKILWGYNIPNKTTTYVVIYALQGTRNQPGRYISETLYIVFLILQICAGYAAVFQAARSNDR
jgi:hypothetical protein